MRIHDVIDRKGADVVTARPDSDIAALVDVLAEHGIGAVVVSEDGSSVDGIVSERDVVRALTDGPDLLGRPISSIMTADVQTCSPDDDLEVVARTMTDGRFRHLPVIADGGLAAIVSIGDIVKHRIDELQTEREQLVDYIQS